MADSIISIYNKNKNVHKKISNNKNDTTISNKLMNMAFIKKTRTQNKKTTDNNSETFILDSESNDDMDSIIDTELNNKIVSEMITIGKELGDKYYYNRFNRPKKEIIIDHTKHDMSQAKKMLCFNILNRCSCPYKDKCVYAHTLNEQNIDPLRQNAFNIINKVLNKENIAYIDLLKDTSLFNNLMQLTKLCMSCHSGICPGGYNCKYGAFNKKYHVCAEDMISGNCMYGNDCNCVHLTDGGLIPISILKNKKRGTYISEATPDIKKQFKNNIKATLLDENYFKQRTGQSISNSEETISEEDINHIKNIMNNKDRQQIKLKFNEEVNEMDIYNWDS